MMDADVEAPGLWLVLGRVVRMRWFNFVPLSESLSSVLSNLCVPPTFGPALPLSQFYLIAAEVVLAASHHCD